MLATANPDCRIAPRRPALGLGAYFSSPTPGNCHRFPSNGTMTSHQSGSSILMGQL
ncbi:MAG: hypothetical protein QOC90_2705 [Mycobacterium sp.]|jgi:hypothetical protein|nr:hypothetical protein [Mycobacterium sp.]